MLVRLNFMEFYAIICHWIDAVGLWGTLRSRTGTEET